MEFETQETYIKFDEAGKISAIVARTRGDSHKLIEEMMLLPIPARLNFRSSMNCRSCIAIMIPRGGEKAARVGDFVKHFGLSFLKKTRHRQIISVSLKRHASALMRLVSIVCYCAPCSKPTMHRLISDTLGWRMRNTATLPHRFAVIPT